MNLPTRVLVINCLQIVSKNKYVPYPYNFNNSFYCTRKKSKYLPTRLRFAVTDSEVNVTHQPFELCEKHVKLCLFVQFIVCEK